MRLHPELLNNSIFLRYYQRWQEDPLSVTFAPISEFFLIYGMIDEAYSTASAGLKEHPDLISGHLAMAKILLKKGDKDTAKNELEFILNKLPDHRIAQGLLNEIDKVEEETTEEKPIENYLVSSSDFPPKADPPLAEILKMDPRVEHEDDKKIEHENDKEEEEKKEEERPKEVVFDIPSYMKTLTMARIFRSQGHREKAKHICESLLATGPMSKGAQEELLSLNGGKPDDNT